MTAGATFPTEPHLSVVVLIWTLIIFNVFQCLSFVFLPFSRWLVWKINRECANLWWGLLELWTEKWKRIQIDITGDDGTGSFQSTRRPSGP